MKLSNESKEFIVFLSIAVLIVLIFSFVLFGMTGARVVLGVIFISLPFYLILNNFELAESEKFVFAVLLGLTIFPSLVYLLGLVVPFRISILLSFVMFISTAIAIWIFKKKI